jgi:exodeoxyribonuclease V alpha subunit
VLAQTIFRIVPVGIGGMKEIFVLVYEPLHMQHCMLLQRNLLYTAITRGRRLVILVGTRKAVAMAVTSVRARRRVTTLDERLKAAAMGEP